VIMYACRTGTERNLNALRAHGWRLLCSPTGELRSEGFPYGLDNGAWTYHQKGVSFNVDKYLRAVDRMGRRADWIVMPDRVADAAATLELVDEWWPRLRGAGLLLLALQDGMRESDVDARLRPGVGLFLGGSDDYKEQSARHWGAFARARSLYFHVGRVNTVRRISIMQEAGAHSVDGKSAAMFAVNTPRLTHAGAQGALRFGHG
jgi:hypothetical protein